MRIPRSPSVLAAPVLSLGLMLATTLSAQEPPPPPSPAPSPAPAESTTEAAPTEATPEKPTQAPAASDEQGPRRPPRRQRAPVFVIEAGTVHPVSGPAITDGVVVVRGEKILAVGKRGEVEVPPNAVVRTFPDGHVYPGLIDAQTDAFAPDDLRNDGNGDGGTHFSDDLQKRGDRSDELAKAGVTTAYVTVRSPALVRGKGAVVRPTKDGFTRWEGKEQAALQLRMTQGLGASHALQRLQQAQAVDALFEGLDEFRKAKDEHAEALKKYEKEFADYLAFHEKKKGGDKADGDKKPEPKPEGAPAAAPAAPGAGPGPGQGGPGGEGRRRRGGPPREEPKQAGDDTTADGTTADLTATDEQALAAMFTELLAMAMQDPKPEPAKQEPAKQEPGKPDAGGAPPGGAAEKKDEGPKRPTYPKKPPEDLQKDALLAVLDGELPLRVEAHRPDELRAALKLQRDREIPVLVLEQAYGADAVASQLAQQAVSVVLTDGLPVPLPAPYDGFRPAALPKRLHDAGVPFAIASGNARLSNSLPLLAAAAVGAGLDAEHALRAITLTPAEILGVAKDTGSLQKDKFADVLVTDRPLFASDSRVLLVLQKGKTEFEAK